MKQPLSIITGLAVWAALTACAQYAVPQAPAASATAEANQTSPDFTPAAPAQDPFSSATGNRMAGTVRKGEWRKFGSWTAAARDGESPVSVISFKAPDQRAVDETAEDLNILSLILSQDLERAFANEAGEYKLGILMGLNTGGRSVEASYLEGFGAVFNLKVRFPLLATAAQEKGPSGNQRDSEWERARRALAGVGDAEVRLWRPTPYEEGRPYDPSLVETLKKRALMVLRNASHLRHVRPEEWVVLTFSGPPNAPNENYVAEILADQYGVLTFSGPPNAPNSEPELAVVSNEAVPGRMGSAAERPRPTQEARADATASGAGGAAPDLEAGGRARSGPVAFRGGLMGGTGAGQGLGAATLTPGRLTVLTIRTKKANADAFAADKMTEDEFFRAAEVTTYLGPAVVGGAMIGYEEMIGVSK